MSAKSSSRFIIRFILALLLILAIANAVYVFRWAPVSVSGIGVEQTTPAEPALPAGVPLEFADHAEDWKYFSRPTWRGEVAYRKEDDGSYSFRVTTVDLRGPIMLTSQEAFVRKADGGKETKIALTKADHGNLIANFTFPTPGEWIIRVRLGRTLETLEFSERIEIK